MSGAGRERGGRTGSPPKPPAGPHLCQQRAVVLQSGSHLLLHGVQVHQDLHEPRGWGEMLGVRDRSSDPQSPPCTPRLPRAPQPLTLLMQVPQGQQALHHVRQTAGHGVPALHHLIDLVDLGGDDRRCGGGSALLGRGCSPPPPHTPGSPPPPPSPCSVCRRPARRLCAWRSHSPSPGRSVGGRQMGPQTTLCPPPSLLAPAPRPPPDLPLFSPPAAGPPLGPAQPNPACSPWPAGSARSPADGEFGGGGSGAPRSPGVRRRPLHLPAQQPPLQHRVRAGLTTRLPPFSPTSRGFCGEETRISGAGGEGGTGEGAEGSGKRAEPEGQGRGTGRGRGGASPHPAVGLTAHHGLQLRQALLQLRDLQGDGRPLGPPPQKGAAQPPGGRTPRSMPWQPGRTGPAPGSRTARR